MRLFLVGATGRTGLALTRQALERGHTVTTFVRSPEKMSVRADRLHVLAGDVFDEAALARALGGHDAVVSTLGATSRAPTTVYGDAARSIVHAMQGNGVERLLVVSSALLYPKLGGLLGDFARYTLRNALADARRMEALVAASDLDWTIVRPPRLTDAEPAARYRVNEGPPHAGSIARADLARCLLDAASETAYSRKVVGVSK